MGVRAELGLEPLSGRDQRPEADLQGVLARGQELADVPAPGAMHAGGITQMVAVEPDRGEGVETFEHQLQPIRGSLAQSKVHS